MQLESLVESPQALAEQIERDVHVHTNGRIRNLRVEVVDQTIVLSGRTSTYYSKQLATHAVFSAAEDVSLSNDIEVC